MIKCTECGYENMDGLDYCDGCGAKLAAAEGAGSAAALRGRRGRAASMQRGRARARTPPRTKRGRSRRRWRRC